MLIDSNLKCIAKFPSIASWSREANWLSKFAKMTLILGCDWSNKLITRI